jgi:hypothetical protein
MSEPLRVPARRLLAREEKRRQPRTPIRPSGAQRKYLERGLVQPGGKLPLFDTAGREIDRKTVESCLEHGWAEPWFANPVKPNWLICKLTAAGYGILGREPPQA